jgi:hypothetical protein
MNQRTLGGWFATAFDCIMETDIMQTRDALLMVIPSYADAIHADQSGRSFATTLLTRKGSKGAQTAHTMTRLKVS